MVLNLVNQIVLNFKGLTSCVIFTVFNKPANNTIGIIKII